jgi:hypothetical protein
MAEGAGPSITRIHHVSATVTDVEASAAWYQRLSGWIGYRSPSGTMSTKTPATARCSSVRARLTTTVTLDTKRTSPARVTRPEPAATDLAYPPWPNHGCRPAAIRRADRLCAHGLSMNSSWPAEQIMRLWCGPPARERKTTSELLRCPRKPGGPVLNWSGEYGQQMRGRSGGSSHRVRTAFTLYPDGWPAGCRGDLGSDQGAGHSRACPPGFRLGPFVAAAWRCG